MQSLFPINLSQIALSNLEAEENKYWGYQSMEPNNNNPPPECLLYAYWG